MMAKFDPRFWEIPVDPEVFDRLAADPPYDEDSETDWARRDEARADAIAHMHVVIRTRLTPKQQLILQLYFFDEMSQEDIAAKLGVAQQVVSKHLFGVVRDGKKIGGALRKLEKALEALKVDPKEWV